MMPSSAASSGSLSEVGEMLPSLLCHEDPFATPQLGALLRQLGSGSAIAELVTSVLASTRLTSEVAARSYHHPLGFDKFILLALLPLGQLRLHVWWPEVSRRTEHIHNHKFDFLSVVVLGEVGMRTYLPAEGGTELAHFAETSAVNGDGWDFRRLGERSVRLSGTASFATGSSYAMRADILHRIDASGVLTATVFLETRSVRKHTSVYVEREPPAQIRCRPFSPAETRARLTRLLRALPPAPPSAANGLPSPVRADR